MTNNQELKTVSVVIPTLNSPTIDQTLTALLKQTYNMAYIEILVVGLDEHNLVKENNIIRFISTKKPAPPAIARNIGLNHASGEIVCFTDSDCIPDPNWVQNLVAAYNLGQNVVGGAVFMPQKGYWAKCDAVTTSHPQLSLQPSGPLEYFASLNFSARREILQQLGGFDESFPKAAGEDFHLCARLRQQGHTLWFASDAIVDHIGWRKTAKTVLGHMYLFGQHTIWLKKDLKPFISPPFFFKHWFLMLLCTPLLALWVTTRIYLRNKKMWAYWYLFFGIYCTRLAWGFGVVHTIRYAHVL